MRRFWIALGVLIASGLIAVSLTRPDQGVTLTYVKSRLMVDLAQPDGYIVTQNLADLPKDWITIPVMRDLFTEETVFYYQQHETKMGLIGALKRITYEHNLQWSDRLIEMLMSRPAQMMLWRDGKGALRHYALIFDQSLETKMVQELAKVALDDRQLRQVGMLNATTPIFALELSYDKEILIIPTPQKVILLSHAGLVFDTHDTVVEASRKAIEGWIERPDALGEMFHIESASSNKHTLVLRAPSVSLGYSALMDHFEGVRLDYDQSWSMRVALAKDVGDPALWNALPIHPSGCMILPIQWDQLHRLWTRANVNQQLDKAKEFATWEGSTMVAWYADGSLYSPVFIVHGRSPISQGALQNLSQWAFEGGSKKLLAPNTQLPMWVGAKGGALAAWGEYVVFSPDTHLIEKTLDTLTHRAPNVADEMAITSQSVGLITPQFLATMAQKEMIDALKKVGDQSLLTAAQQQLPPRLNALGHYAPYRIDLGANDGYWRSVQWRSLTR